MVSARKQSFFGRCAKATSRASGRPLAFVLAVAIILAWGLTGPIFGFSDTWQLVINTSTTIITFLMVFVIQNSQNRDGEALQVKLDELIRVTRGAHNALLDLEEIDEDELDRICETYRKLARNAREKIEEGKADTEVVSLDGAIAQVGSESNGK